MRARWIGVFIVLSACGDAHSESIDDIPPDTTLSELSDSELDIVCDWTDGLARHAFEHAECDGLKLSTSGCMTVSDSCEIRLGQYKAWAQGLIKCAADNPCELVDVLTSGDASQAMTYVAETPHCDEVGACVTLR
jgi:hypothetical protein